MKKNVELKLRSPYAFMVSFLMQNRDSFGYTLSQQAVVGETL
jgi:hypothetical protein